MTATTSKTCAGRRGLVLRQVHWLAGALPFPHCPRPWRSARIVADFQPLADSKMAGHLPPPDQTGPPRLQIGERHDPELAPARPCACAPHHPEGSEPRRRRRAGVRPHVRGAGTDDRHGVTPAEDGPIWSAEYWAKKGDVSLNLWRKRVGAPKPGEPPAAGAVPGARLLELRALVVRPHRAGQGRVFAHERHGAPRLRRLDHGPRRLRLLRQLRQQLRHRQRRRGPQSRDPGGDRRRPGRARCTSTAPRPAPSAPAPTRRSQPERVDRLVLVAFTYKGTGAPEIGRRARRVESCRQQSPQARRRHDPLDLHPRRPRLELRPGGARGDRGRGAASSAIRCRPEPISTWPPTCRWSIRRRCSRPC